MGVSYFLLLLNSNRSLARLIHKSAGIRKHEGMPIFSLFDYIINFIHFECYSSFLCSAANIDLVI